MAGAGGEDPVAVPAGRDEHCRRCRDGRGREGRIEDGNPDALPRIAAPVPVRIGGVAEERVGEGEGDEAGRRDAPQALQLRAHRHRALAGTATDVAARQHNEARERSLPRGFLYPEFEG